MAKENYDLSEFKYSYLKDPETCPIEELEQQVKDLEQKVAFYDTKQLAIKKFINSVYGALGSKYFCAHNTAIAESITAQGRDLNHYSENSVNKYFKGLFQSNPKITLYYHWIHIDEKGDKFTFGSEDKPADYYNTGKWEECSKWDAAVKKGKKLTPELKSCLQDNSQGKCDWFMTSVNLFTKLGMSPEQQEKATKFDISKGMTKDTGELTGEGFEYLDGTRSMVVGGDTDSFSGNSLLDLLYKESGVDVQKRMPVDKFFELCKYMNMDTVLKTPAGAEVVPVKDISIRTYDEDSDNVTFRNVNYVMRHKVNKARYRITTESGKSVIVTEDHSCMVVRDGELITVKASEINKETDKIISAAI